MNAQANLMKSSGLLMLVVNSIENILKSSSKTFSSNELFRLLPSGIQNSIVTISSKYYVGACKEPASYVGTAASMLCKMNSAYYHEYNYYCPVLHKNEDGFRRKYQIEL